MRRRSIVDPRRGREIMNAPEHIFLPDLQASMDERKLAIDRVGIRGIRHPVMLATSGSDAQPTIATFDMFVRLASHLKGTHMSRFVELLHALTKPIAPGEFRQLHAQMLQRLEADAGYLQMRAPYFRRKRAPVSGVESLLDYELTLIEERAPGLPRRSAMRVVVPVTSLCPCSKEISAYGAHNQRSHVTLSVDLNEAIGVDELIDLAEGEASCEIYSLLKRPDEKYVTERAYDNPKFVEDMVRDIAGRLERDPRVRAYRVESENFESIHNHSAYALLERSKAPQESPSCYAI
jgi:GTP cyclohydrolase IB